MKSKPILVALIIGGAFVAVAMFSISFHGLYLFAAGPMDLDHWAQRSALPIGLDVGQLMAAGTAIMVTRRRPRVFAWGVTVLAVGLSGAGNYWSAHVRDLGMAGALAPMIAPAFLALVAELLVFVWREMYPPPEPEPEPEPESIKQAQPKAAPATSKSKRGRGIKLDPIEVQRLQAAGMTQVQVAAELGSHKRTVARYWKPKEPSPNGHEPVGEMA